MTITEPRINHSNTRASILREDYLYICDGDRQAAIILNMFEFWYNGLCFVNHKLMEIDTVPIGYKTTRDFVHFSLNQVCKTSVPEKLEILMNKGFITRQTKNGKTTNGDRHRYSFNVKAIEQALQSFRGTSYQERELVPRVAKNGNSSKKIVTENGNSELPKTGTIVTENGNSERSSPYIYKNKKEDLSKKEFEGEKKADFFEKESEIEQANLEEILEAKIEGKEEAEVKVSINTPSLAKDKTESQASNSDLKQDSTRTRDFFETPPPRSPQDRDLESQAISCSEQSDEFEPAPTQTTRAIEAYENRMKAGLRPIPEGVDKPEQQFWLSRVGQFVLAKIGDAVNALAFVECRRKEISLSDFYQRLGREAEAHEARKNIKNEFYREDGLTEIEEAIASFLKRIAPKAEKKWDYTVHKISDEKYGEPSPEFLKCRELARQAIKKIQEENNRNQPLYGGEISLGIA